MTTETKKKSYALPIAIMFALFFMIAFVTGYQNPLGSVIMEKSKGNAIMSQLPTFANFIAYAIMGLPAGIILQRKGYRFTALAAVGVGFTGVLISYLSGFIDADMPAVVVYIIGAFVSGFSMCMLNTVVNPMLNSLGKNERQGNQLIQFGGSCNSLGATLAPVVVGLLMGSSATSIAAANPVFYLAMCIFAIAAAVIYFSKLPESPDLGTTAEKVSILPALRHRNFLLGALAIFFYVGIEVGIPNFLQQYLTDKDSAISVPLSVAGAIVGTYWLMMLVGRLIGGAVGGKVSSRSMLTTVSVVALMLISLALFLPSDILVDVPGFVSGADGFHFTFTKLPISILLFVLCGLCTSVMWGAIFNLSVSGLGKYTQVASGLFMCLVCGGGVMTVAQSALAGEGAGHAYLDSYWLTFAMLIYLLFYAVIGSRTKTDKETNPDKV